MVVELLDKTRTKAGDLIFLGLVLTSLALGIGAISSNMDARNATLTYGGARRVDPTEVRKQILDGSLSPHKALFFRRLRK